MKTWTGQLEQSVCYPAKSEANIIGLDKYSEHNMRTNYLYSEYSAKYGNGHQEAQKIVYHWNECSVSKCW